ncbi:MULTISPECIES: S9 family peptidase [unclassified Acidiphilium]|uniref:S9 family peptidase n=1 Tax=unclassified Acidiphilium TaxID=2617493 RepID=UPI000214567A|nr:MULTISPECIES: S9 family peptidase [unclassified Acidiphilium]EGO96647.1 Peptidase S9 prolyl oligopeptidase [Acidiphilium sp. PM]
MDRTTDTTALPLIPRAALFGNPRRAGAQISPDGGTIAFLAPRNGVMNLFVAPRGRIDAARPLTDERRRGIPGYAWAHDGRHLLVVKDNDGDENFHLHAVDRETGAMRDLTPHGPIQASIVKLSPRHPGEAVVSHNARDPQWPDLYRIEIATGRSTMIAENPGLAGFDVDEDFALRLAARLEGDGSQTVLRPDGAGGWAPFMRFAPEDAMTSGVLGLFTADGRRTLMLSSAGRDTAALFRLDLETGEATMLAEDARADIGEIIVRLHENTPLAYGVNYERNRYVALDPAIQPDLDALDAAGIGDWGIQSRSEDDRFWIVGAASDTAPGVAWLYDRKTRALEKLYDTRPDLADAPLAPMRPVVIAARDGLSLVSYLTLPADGGSAPRPLVLLVHGGPWARDSFGFNPYHQWLANRGYAVLSVNFRASTGFGKAFLNAGDREWGRAMDDDLLDAVDWAIGQGIADPSRIAIMGGSYGGYATLAAMTRNPERYACGVDIVGPSNLETLLATIPPYWEAGRSIFTRALGDPATPEGAALLRERSPVHQAARLARPLLIGQGANDPRVKQAESDQMVAALKAKGIAVTYVLFPDEGHGFARPENSIAFNAITEHFLAAHLGGRAEALAAEEIGRSTAQLLEGAEILP